MIRLRRLEGVVDEFGQASEKGVHMTRRDRGADLARISAEATGSAGNPAGGRGDGDPSSGRGGYRERAGRTERTMLLPTRATDLAPARPPGRSGYGRAAAWAALGLACFLACQSLPTRAEPAPPDARALAMTLYQAHCAACHGKDRLGGTGPALLPESLERMKPADLVATIRDGRPSTRMEGFADRLSPAKIQALADYVATAPAVAPIWDLKAIRRSRILLRRVDPRVARPVFDADPLNLFVVVETGNHSLTILDGDKFRVLHRFPTRFALHGGPKFSQDGRFVYTASRDGWVARYDLATLEQTAEIRAGLNTRNLALSGDDRYVMVGNALPPGVVILDARDLSPMAAIPTMTADGKPSRVSAVYQAEPRHSFIVALKDAAELWEVPYDAPGKPREWVHDHGADGGEEATIPQFPVRRVALSAPLDDFYFTPSYRHVLGASRKAARGQVVDLEAGRVVAEVDIGGMPHLASGISWMREGKRVMATPDLLRPEVSVIDIDSWQPIARIPTAGPGFFLRSHEATPYAWADVFSGPHKGKVHVIDKQSLQVIRTLEPAPGRTVGHVEFTRDGRFALVSVWESDGGLVVYDARTLEEVARVPLNRPAGKYNVFNKTRRSEGTSH